MSKKIPFISIITVNYNGRKYLRMCFDTIFRINYPKNKFEIIMVDNCSTDTSIVFARKRYPKIRIIKNDVNNYCKANNLGIKEAKGEYVALINNDIKVDKNWLIELINVIKEDKNIAAVGSKILSFDGKYIQNAGHYELPNFYWGERGAGREKSLYNKIEELPSICGASVLYRKSCIEQVGLFDEDFIIYGEDVDMSYRLRKIGYKLMYVPKSKVYHVFHGSGNGAISKFYIERNRLLFLAKHFPWKLSDSMFGKGAFTVDNGLDSCGKLYEILPDAIFTLLKNYSINSISGVVKCLFEELKKISTYEHDKLTEEVKTKHIILTKHEKEFNELTKKYNLYEEELKNYRLKEKEFNEKYNSLSNLLSEKNWEFTHISNQLKQRMDELLIKDGQLSEKDQELTNLWNQLKQRMDELLIKDGQLSEKDQQLINLHEELTNITNQFIKKEHELTNLWNQLKQRMDEVLIKDGQLIEKNEELNNLSNQLKDRIDEVLIKNTQLFQQEQALSDLKQQLSSKDIVISQKNEEFNSLSNQLKQRMDELLIKDGQLSEKDQQLINLHEELTNITNQFIKKDQELTKLQNEFVQKKQIINEKERELNNLRVQLERKINELNGIYNSNGFRFILRPLWTILWNIKLGFKKVKTRLTALFLLTITIFLTPVFFFIYLSLLFENLLWNLLKPYLKNRISERYIISFDKLKVSIVIPSWNGIDLLKECLNSIFVLAEFKNDENEVLVVDDSSTDGTYEFIKQNYPNVRIIQNEKNMGFGYTCNRGVKEAKNELIVLINNDILLTENFLKPIKEHFRDESVFAVTPKLYGWDRETFMWGMHMGHFKNGYISLWNESEIKNGNRIYEASPTIFAIGGAMVFRRNDFLWLGGFDGIYRPNCWEDIDISYRAWKRGLKVIYEPNSLMYHKGKATLTYERYKEIKNEISFTWKNITDLDILKEHLNLLPTNLQKGGLPFLKGFLWALNLLPVTLSHRFKERRYIKVRDVNILNYCMNYYENFIKNGFKHLPKNKKNILMVTLYMPYPLNRGGNIRICTIAKLLKDKYDVYLLTLAHSRSELDFIPELKQIFKDVIPVYKNTTMLRDLAFPDTYKHAYWKKLIEKLKEMQGVVPLDIIQIESNELLYLLDFIKFTPVVYTEHDISILSFGKSYYKYESSNFLINFFDYLKRVNFHKIAYKKLQNVITLSEQDNKLLKMVFPDINFKLMQTGVDLNFFFYEYRHNQNNMDKKIVYIGHYKHYPNTDAVVYFVKEIFPLIKMEIKNVEFLIVGSEPTEAVKSLSQHQGVNVIGTVDDVRPYLRSADVFVSPIRISAGIKGKVLEAMACGVPVVSTKKGAFGIDAQHNKEVLIADSPTEFANHVVSLFKNSDLHLKLSQNARRLVENKYDWQNIARNLDNLYGDIASTPEGEADISEGTSIDRITNEINGIVERRIEEVELEGPEQGPEELHIELTYNCNSKCIMCDLWDYNKRAVCARKEITLQEIDDFIGNSTYLKRVKTVALSGGEPFLREDIVEICGIVLKHLPDTSISILTNALNTEEIIRKTKEIIRRHSPKSILLGSSLDGIGAVHDRIRGKKGAFIALKKTIDRCRLELPGVDIALTFTLTPYNFKHLISAKEFADIEGLKFYAQFVVPKETREQFKWKDCHFKKIEKDIYCILKGSTKGYDLEKILQDSNNGNINSTLLANLYYWLNLAKYQRIQKRFFKKCIAGSRFAMLNPFGDIYFCPILKNKIIGNVCKEKFDKLWLSEKARAVRDFIQEEVCHCWLVCVIFPMIDEVFTKKENKKYIYHDNTINYKQANDKSISLNEEEFRLKRTILNSTPQIVGIGAHYRCNAKCVFCLDGDYPNFNLDIYKKFFEKKLGKVLRNSSALNLCGYGEVLLIPDALIFLQYINKTIPSVNKIITTNGISLNFSVAKVLMQSKYTIQISLHASNQKLHNLITGVNVFETVIKQIEKLVSSRPDNANLYISLIFVINSMNVKDLPDFVKLAIKLGVDEVICNYLTIYKPSHARLSCFYKQDITNEMIVKAEELARIHDFRLKTPPKFGQDLRDNGNYICSEPWKYFYVETQGSVLPCCYAERHIGYLNQKEFDEIWNGKEYQELRRMQIEKKSNGVCKNCYKFNKDNINNLTAHVNIGSLKRYGVSIEDLTKDNIKGYSIQQ